jgi:flagellar biosynthesis protein FlhA
MAATSTPVSGVGNPALAGGSAPAADAGKRFGPARLGRGGAGPPPAGGIHWAEAAVPVSVVGVVLAMITPLPPFLVDVLISANITISVVILLVGMYITRPVEFSVFPTTLLLMTLFRLALNVTSSRLILLHGNSGTAAAGRVIEGFGNFVVGGNYIIGVVIFLVLIAIQYVVINHGAVRISEVTARFTLDAMPGKQMSIDSDLNAGLIDEAEAKSRRKLLSQESEFFGAMDGASRFTQRDAVASILITAINIVAGFLIGVFQHGMDLTRALQTYTVLTIGDGLVTVIPALMISISGGLVVTRASSDNRLGADFSRQVFGHVEPLALASGVLVVLAFFPGFPAFPFLMLSAAVGTVAWYRNREARAGAAAGAAAAAPAPPRESLEALLRVEPLAVEVGLGLVKLVEGAQSSPLLRRIGSIRRQLAGELGYLLPPVRVVDNVSLKAREYLVSLKGVEVARYEMPSGRDLAIASGQPAAALDGLATHEPAFGLPAVWIPSEAGEAARGAGYTVVDPVSVLGTHLAELVRRHAHELFTRQDAKLVLDRVAEENPKVVEDLVPKLVPLAVVQKILQNLLRERVSIRDAVTILEALGEAANITRNSVLLTEYVRQAIRRMVVKPYLNAAGDLPAYFIEPAIEQGVEQAVEHAENTSHLNLAPQRIREIVERFARVAGTPETPVAALAGSGARYFLRLILEANSPNLFVLSHSEVPPGVKVISLGTVQ